MGVNSFALMRGERYKGGPLAPDVVAQLNQKLNYPDSSTGGGGQVLPPTTRANLSTGPLKLSSTDLDEVQ